MLFGLAFAGILINHDPTGYVPVINRGQRDIESNKSIAKALQSEREFFENHPSYRSKAQYCGTPFLARKLNMVCMLFFVNVDHSYITHGYPFLIIDPHASYQKHIARDQIQDSDRPCKVSTRIASIG